MASESTPSRSPLQGYNHNIRYGSRVYHVQTEDSGVDHPHLFTHLFHSGVIIATARTDYAELAPQPGHEPKVRKLMQTQHKRLMKELRGGQFDQKITELLGVDEELEARKAGKKARPGAPGKRAATPAAPPRTQAGHLPRDTEREPVPPTLSPPVADPSRGPEIPPITAFAPDLQVTPHPVATSIEPELQARLDADDARTLRMTVRSEWDEANTTSPEAVPHVIIDQPIEPSVPDAPVHRDTAEARQRPTGSTPQRYTAPSGHRAEQRGTAPPPPRQPRATGSYGPSDSQTRASRPVVGRTAGDGSDSGVYQITLGGARPVSKARGAPRVLARPAVIVDRAPARPSSGSTLQKVLSGMSSPAGGHVGPARGEQQATGGGRQRPQTRSLHNLFGSDLISERSLDEVILQYLSEDQEQ